LVTQASVSSHTGGDTMTLGNPNREYELITYLIVEVRVLQGWE
jgi:hypothetical protein